jgi:pimeloyl-ACP methyl ester carboxylesterase
MSITTPTRITTQYAGLVADTSGHDDGRPPLVLLHGLTFDRTTWRPVLDQLDDVDPGRRIVAFDLPDHGASAPLPSHDLEDVAAAVHDAVEAAGLEQPVLVGHSISAVIASIYAALYPTAGVVCVDAILRVGPFAEMLAPLAAVVRGPGYEQVWSELDASMHAERLAPDAQAIVRATSRPKQDQFVTYQRELFDVPVAELEGRAHVVLAVLRAAGRPFEVIAGDSVGPDDERWLRERLPQASVEVWPGCGHFPFLAQPRRFAERLVATAAWPTDRSGSRSRTAAR